MDLSYPNKYFTAKFIDLVDKDSAEYSDVIFLRDIGPFKAGDRYPEGYISIIFTRINTFKLKFEMLSEMGNSKSCIKHTFNVNLNIS